MDDGELRTGKHKDKEEDDENEERDVGWLQLGVGSHGTEGLGLDSMDTTYTATQMNGLVKPELFSDKRHANTATDDQVPQYLTCGTITSTVSSMPMHWPHTRTSLIFRQQLEVPWDGYRHDPWNMMASSSSMSHHCRPLQHPYIAGAVTQLRVIDTPLRPQSGLWFVLQASQNQGKEPFLPQINKSYLRIKDGRMTVGLLMQYLAKKLGLSCKSEIEIMCKRQQLPSFLTMQHVRDSIWCSRDSITSFPDTPNSEHVMILQYGRSS